MTVRELCFSTPAHHHAEVGGLDDDADAARLQRIHDRIGDLVGEALLHLQAAGEHVHDAGRLGEAHDAAMRDVRHVRPAEERQHVVLAQRVELDVLHQDHALVRLLEERVADHLLERLRIAPREEAV